MSKQGAAVQNPELPLTVNTNTSNRSITFIRRVHEAGDAASPMKQEMLVEQGIMTTVSKKNVKMHN